MNKLPLITLPYIQVHREFDFHNKDFERLRQLIYKEAGIVLTLAKKDMVYGRLVKRIRALKLSGFAAYADLLESRNGRQEFEQFVNALTTNLTFFFREEHHFPILSEYLKQKLTHSRSLSIWCAASSTGEEPYSIAITVLETLSNLSTHSQVHILATDLDTSVLAVGQQGIYSADKIARLPAGFADKYFSKVSDKTFQAKPSLRNMVTFQPLNLCSLHWHIKQSFDVIFCRNVMIYFDRQTQLSVLKRFIPLLKPDGLLFVGHSENFYFVEELQLRGKTVYEHNPRKA